MNWPEATCYIVLIVALTFIVWAMLHYAGGGKR